MAFNLPQDLLWILFSIGRNLFYCICIVGISKFSLSKQAKISAWTIKYCQQKPIISVWELLNLKSAMLSVFGIENYGKRQFFMFLVVRPVGSSYFYLAADCHPPSGWGGIKISEFVFFSSSSRIGVKQPSQQKWPPPKINGNQGGG